MNAIENIEYRTINDRPYSLDGLELWCHLWYIQKYYPDEGDDMQCRILKKLGMDRYMVELLYVHRSDEGLTDYWGDGIMWNVPSDALYFADEPFTRDHHMFESFRHAMMVPDDLFPEAWKDRKLGD